MTFIKLNENCSVECKEVGNTYHYSLKEGDEEPYSIGHHSKSPLEHSKSTAIGKQIYKQISKSNEFTGNKNTDWEEVYLKEFNKVLQQLDDDIQQTKKQVQKELQKQEEDTEDNYLTLAGHFETICKNTGFTPLQVITRISEGLGVDAHLQIMQAHMGYSQTYYSLKKGTNVIAIGSQSSGKTHCLEMALDMIPQESIHRGTMTEASFFKEFNGEDLSGQTFYMGDLGGVNDDEKTAPTRTIVKQLSTDGYVKRGLVDTNINENTKEWVEGYPAISYTSANEDIIDPQERSRSVLIHPPDVNQKKLILFNSFNESPGNDWELKQKIERDKESVKGYVYKVKKEIGEFEVFNPYAFCIQEHLKDIEDFNRKIEEFDRALRIICIYSNAKKLTHYIYKNDNFEDIPTKLLIPSKQNNVDTLTLFDSSIGLLPTDIKLADGLFTKYAIYELENNKPLEEYFENLSFEEKVTQELIQKNPDTVRVGEDFEPKKWNQITAFNEKEEKDLPCFFTIDSVKKHSNSKWYRPNSKVMAKKLNKLHEHGVLIKIGKTSDGRNIYGLSNTLMEKIYKAVPKFNENLVKLGINEFKRKYKTANGDLIDEFMEFMNNDKDPKGNSFEITKDDHLYELPWNNLGDDK